MQRSKHSLSHYRLTSLNQGILYPVSLLEVLPGDSFRHQSTALIRVAPLVAPVMHPVRVALHNWFVPTRLLWDNWEPFITGRDPSLVLPTITINPAGDAANQACHKLASALGIGVDTATYTVCSLPFRAYNLIWNEFYRDQDLDPVLTVRLTNTGDVPADFGLYSVRWEKDYFTTARPYPQQGTDTEVVQLSLTGHVPIAGIGTEGTAAFPTGPVSVRDSSVSGSNTYTKALSGNTGSPQRVFFQEDPSRAGYPIIRADLSQLAGSVNMDINKWRQSMAMQRMKEHRNRFGSRYRDMLAFLGVNSSDARLQRPEYLGGGKQTISFSEVLSTAETTGAAVGEMAGHGIAALRTRPYKRFFEEHGYCFSHLFARPETVYLNKVPRHFLRRDYEHYWQKELEMMGDQAITNFEVYGDAPSPSGTFGYIPRYDEYRHASSYVSGEFRSILDYWHMGRKFSSQPALNSAFLKCDPTTRIYASAVTDQLYAMIAHKISARRLVSKHARN